MDGLDGIATPDQAAGQFASAARRAILTDRRRIVIVGARGWIGRVLLALLHGALGDEAARARIHCFGSSAGTVEVEADIIFNQAPLAELTALPHAPTMLFHLAFLTKDKVGGIDDVEYRRINRTLSQHVLAALDPLGVDRLFVASSGAAAFADDTEAAHDLRLYGSLKREDEARFAAWADASDDARRAVVTRIFNISGPYINKHQTYALASFILDALAGRTIEVRAPMPVIRGYVAARELLSVVVAAMLSPTGGSLVRFDSGGEPLELAEVAARVAATISGGPVSRRPITQALANRYVGDDVAYRSLARSLGVEHVPLDRQILETASFLARAQFECNAKEFEVRQS